MVRASHELGIPAGTVLIWQASGFEVHGDDLCSGADDDYAGVPRSYENAPHQDPTVSRCLES
jgi:hypothetical protein